MAVTLSQSGRTVYLDMGRFSFAYLRGPSECPLLQYRGANGGPDHTQTLALVDVRALRSAIDDFLEGLP